MCTNGMEKRTDIKRIRIIMIGGRRRALFTKNPKP